MKEFLRKTPNGLIFAFFAFKNGGGMIITDAKAFGEALRARRKEKQYTQAFLAEFTGYSVSFISDLENGKPTAELGKAMDLANILGLDVHLTAR